MYLLYIIVTMINDAIMIPQPAMYAYRRIDI